jgi:hypothetical protein
MRFRSEVVLRNSDETKEGGELLLIKLFLGTIHNNTCQFEGQINV